MTAAKQSRGLPSFTLALLLVLSSAAAFPEELGQASRPDHGAATQPATAPAGHPVRHRKRKRRESNPRSRLRAERRSKPTTPMRPQHRLR